MEEGSTSSRPGTVQEVFKDFKCRRAGILKALTTDVMEFFVQCDPAKGKQCLYGFPDESWEVTFPWEEVPPDLPEPAIGINFARDGVPREDWLSFVAKSSDSWLLSVAYLYCARFDQNGKKFLFDMIHELPTVFDVVTGKAPVEEKTSVKHSGENKTKSTRSRKRRVSAVQVKKSKRVQEEEKTLVEEDEEDGDTMCGSCGEHQTADGFWIGCDGCEKWFHGICVKVTPARAKLIKRYQCASCSEKGAPS